MIIEIPVPVANKCEINIEEISKWISVESVKK